MEPNLLLMITIFRGSVLHFPQLAYSELWVCCSMVYFT